MKKQYFILAIALTGIFTLTNCGEKTQTPEEMKMVAIKEGKEAEKALLNLTLIERSNLSEKTRDSILEVINKGKSNAGKPTDEILFELGTYGIPHIPERMIDSLAKIANKEREKTGKPQIIITSAEEIERRRQEDNRIYDSIAKANPNKTREEIANMAIKNYSERNKGSAKRFIDSIQAARNSGK